MTNHHTAESLATARDQALELLDAGVLSAGVYADTMANIDAAEAKLAARAAKVSREEQARKDLIAANVAAGRFTVTRGRIA